MARLLGAPHVEFHALDLVGGAGSGRGEATAAVAVGAGIEVRARGEGDAGPALDNQAKAAYRSRVAELQEEIDEAESFNDPERARVNVTRSIRTALKRIAEHDPVLGRQLGAAIKTGTFCVYEPAPGEEPAWDLTGPA